MNDNQKHIKWFRDSAPYINAHRNKTFVLYLGGAALETENFHNVISDIALLHSLGVRLVLVHGAAPQIDRHLVDSSKEWETVDGMRVTPPELLGDVISVIGRVRSEIEAKLSMGLVNSPMHGADITVTTGNFVKAKPLGIINGEDFYHTGTTRRVNTSAIHQQLDSGAVVLISPLGYSPSGEIFNLHSAKLVTDISIALGADKLIYFSDQPGVLGDDGNIISELQAGDIERFALDDDSHMLSYCRTACLQGINRCHIVSYVDDGALLEELFTRDGSGTQITRVSYEQIRTATSDDVAGIIELIEPLEATGVLVKRSRELIESEMKQFTVIERDGLIVSCAALYPFGQQGELACLVTHPDYRDNDRGERLLAWIENEARRMGVTNLFVLTTHSAHWFTERGFQEKSVTELPESRKLLYNYQRNSKYFEKTLDSSC